jgi:hypothetical protein
MSTPTPRMASRRDAGRGGRTARRVALTVFTLVLAATPFDGYGHGGALELSVSPDTIAAGEEVTLAGEGFAVDAQLEVHLTGPNGDAHFDTLTADDEGGFTRAVRIPADVIPGIYLVRVAGDDREASAELTIGAMAGMAATTRVLEPERERSNTWRAVALVLLLGVGIVGVILARANPPDGAVRHSV